jgi:hypothetical protein
MSRFQQPNYIKNLTKKWLICSCGPVIDIKYFMAEFLFHKTCNRPFFSIVDASQF